MENDNTKLASRMEGLEFTVDKLGFNIEKLTQKFGDFAESIDQRFDVIDQRFNKVDEEIRGLGVLMEDMDDKFIVTEGQDLIREVLETRVAHIEEILDVKSAA